MRLANRSAVITGASSGIGRAIALRFAAEGARVTLADRSQEPREGGRPTLALIREAGGEATFAKTDISHWDEVDRLIGGAVERFGRLDVMVNNAAISVGKALTETSEAEWDETMDVNLKGFPKTVIVQPASVSDPAGIPDFDDDIGTETTFFTPLILAK